MELRNRQQLLTIAAIAVAALFAGDKLLLTPLINAWKARAARVAELRLQVEDGQAMLNREKVVRTRWEQLRRSTLPSNTSAAEQSFFNTVDRWARDSRVTVNALTPQWKRDAKDYLTLQCRIDASGNLGTLSRFIYNIERDPMAVHLQSLEVGARDKDGQVLSLALQISGLVLNPVLK
jgi:hypothetical protein